MSEGDVLVQAQSVISELPEEIDRDWAREQFPDADYVEVRDRTQSSFLVGAGEEPYPMICPECGEGVYSGQTIGDGWYYRHVENDECELDSQRKLEERREEKRSERRRQGTINTLVSGAVVIVVAFAVFQFIPSTLMSVNGEPVTIDPSQMVVPAVVLVLFAMLIILALQWAPGHVGGGRYA